MTTTHAAPFGPPPPLVESDSTDESPAYYARWIGAQQAHTAWTLAQLDAYRDALAIPTGPAPIPCACPECTPHAVPLADEYRPMFGPPRSADRWARLRIEQRHQRRRAAALAAAPPRFPRFPSARITAADALAVALDSGQTMYQQDRKKAERATARHTPASDPDDIPTKMSQSRSRLAWPERTVTLPAVLTAPHAILAIPGRLPALAPDQSEPHALHRYTVAPGHPVVLTAGGWTADTPTGGTVAHHARLDVDGKPAGTGGRAKTSRRPSTVPTEAVKSRNQLNTPIGRVRVWCWLDKFGQVQARTLSGHDVQITTAARRALAQQISKERTAETI